MKLAHFSVKEFLVPDRIAHGAAKYFSIGENLSHSFIAKTSLAYLLHLDSSGLDDKTLAAAPLATYAVRNWVFHVRSGEGDGERSTQKLIAALLESRNALVNWIRLWDPENLQHGIQRQISSTEVAEPLYYASLLDFPAASRRLLDNGARVNPRRTGGQRTQNGAFMWTCDETMVKLLLERGADVNMPGGEYSCALQAAACRGSDEAMVELLLDSGADVDMQGGKYHTALQAAVFNEHNGVKDLLMAKGAAIDRSSVVDQVSFEAVTDGDPETVKWLLEKGVNVNMSGGVVGSPLHVACSSRKRRHNRASYRKQCRSQRTSGNFRESVATWRAFGGRRAPFGEQRGRQRTGRRLWERINDGFD